MENSFEHCTSEPITKNLTIRGPENELAVLHCDKINFEGHETPLLFHFENVTIIFRNLQFNSSHILASNVELEIANCIFDNSALFIMGTRRYVHYFDETELYDIDVDTELKLGYIYWTPWAEKYWGPSRSLFAPLTCFKGFITLINVKWLPQKNEAPMKIDAPKQLDCKPFVKISQST